MLILAIDSAMSGCSACVYRSDAVAAMGGRNQECAVLAQEHMHMSCGQAEPLIPLVVEVMERSGVEFSDLDLIAVTNGPGAFTGMRIALAAAKSIAMVVDKPVVGISTFYAVMESCVLHKYEGGETDNYFSYAVMIDTKRNDYYFQMFDGKTRLPICDAMVCDLSEIASIIGKSNTLLIGDAHESFVKENKLNVEFYYIDMPDVSVIAELAAERYMFQSVPVDCELVYLRAPEIGTPKNKLRVIE